MSTMNRQTKTDVNTSRDRHGVVEQEFYRPREAAQMLGITQRTLFTLISKGRLHSIKLTDRVTIISRKEIFDMIENAMGETLSRSIFANETKTTAGNHEKDDDNSDKTSRRKVTHAADVAPLGVTHDTHYTMAEICNKFNYSYGRLYALRMRYEIPKIHAFGTSCFPKDIIDKVMAEEKERMGRTLSEHWYTCGELMRIYGLGKTQVRRFAKTHNVRTKKARGNRLFYLKEDWEAERRKAESGSSSTKEKRDGAS